MLLEKLIKISLQKKKKFGLKGLAINSKKIKGIYFFAIKGNKINGENFIEEAIRKVHQLLYAQKTVNIEKAKV